MAKKRLIDTEEFYFDTELCDLLGARGLHLYVRLWGIAEDWGGYELKYNDIALKMGALKFSNKETEKYITNLLNSGKIIEYQSNNKKMHWIVNFLKHQSLDNPALPRLPLPEWITCEIKEYPSKKKYAKYTIITEKLPVGYQNTTGRTETVSKETVSKETSSLYPAFEQKVFVGWNSFCDSYPILTKIDEITAEWRLKLKKRYEKASFQDFNAILTAISTQSFLLGENERGWKVSFDWLIKNDTNYIKVLKQNYKDSQPKVRR